MKKGYGRRCLDFGERIERAVELMEKQDLCCCREMFLVGDWQASQVRQERQQALSQHVGSWPQNHRGQFLNWLWAEPFGGGGSRVKTVWQSEELRHELTFWVFFLMLWGAFVQYEYIPGRIMGNWRCEVIWVLNGEENLMLSYVCMYVW